MQAALRERPWIELSSTGDFREIWRLRVDAFCRDGQGPKLVEKPEVDLAVGTRHFGIRDDNGLVAVVTLLPEQFPGAPAPVPGGQHWQFRMMAVHPDRQGRGHARTLLDHLTDVVASAGGGVLWGNMRQSAWQVYEQLGFVCVGEAKALPPVGTPHRLAYLQVPDHRPRSAPDARQHGQELPAAVAAAQHEQRAARR